MFHIYFHNLFAPNQYGLRSGTNTTDCLVDLIEQITNWLKFKKRSLAKMIKKLRAFDCPNCSLRRVK